MDSYYRLVSYQQRSLDSTPAHRASADHGSAPAMPSLVAMMSAVWAVLAMVLLALRS